MDPAIFPEEIWIKILLHCDIPDIIIFGRTCKYLRKISNSEYLWKMKWLQLLSQVHFRFPGIKQLQSYSVNFKEMCYRLHMIIKLDENVHFLQCHNCYEYTCKRDCTEMLSYQIIIEIGNKYTRVVDGSFTVFSVNKHFSSIAFPTNFSKKHEEEGQIINVQKSNITVMPKNKIKEDHKLRNDYCTDIELIRNIPNIEMLNPAKALLNSESFLVLKAFLDHLFHPMNIIFKEPGFVLMFCEPLGTHPASRKQLLHYLFQEVKAARVCLVPKPLLACSMLDIKTCIVVDSGALSTTVAVVINGRVMPQRWKLLPIGGWHVSYHLKQAVHRKQKEYHQIPLLSLDFLPLKGKCRLSYNIKNEKREEEQKIEQYINLNVTDLLEFGKFKHIIPEENFKPFYQKISLGSELYIAPEMMYVSLELPKVIKEVTSGLSEDIMHDCFSHIMLIGGNTSLSGFNLRLIKDLRELFPEYSEILEVQNCPEDSFYDWKNYEYLSLYVCSAMHSDEIPPEYVEGYPYWLSREEYVLFGCDSLG
ncbi:uncharacterized protein LOC122524618 [Polistes fuscatus]|uniref:uncharacterized protein LOC122524618 n=1 Tax=Polistes fuscatus TaxID=30207 RepID=UPI001CA86663|nr:uncharacterized protein LOC122524618 [Polistes fuscatus]